MCLLCVQLKELKIPVESGLTAGLMEGREARHDEHKQMKELVLNYERKQEEEAYQCEWGSYRLYMYMYCMYKVS